MRAKLDSATARALVVALVVLALYGAGAIWIDVAGEPVKQAVIGQEFLDQGRGASRPIDALRGSASSRVGYDGQFALYIALDPGRASSYVDIPAYRYSRILYPLSARAAAVGRSSAVPLTLILVNVASAFVLALAVALLLSRVGVSPWFALVGGFAPGLAFGILDDLTEPLAYALVAVGMVVLDRHEWRWRVPAAGVAFGLAGLARETALLFPLAAAFALAFWATSSPSRRQHLRDGLMLALVSLAPAVVLRLVLSQTLAGAVAPKSARPDPVPFHGLISSASSGTEWAMICFVVVPAVLSLGVAALAVHLRTGSFVALALNVLVLVVLLPRASWDSYPTSARVTLGVPIAFLLCLPLVKGTRARLAVALVPMIWWLPGWATVISEFRFALSQ